MEITYRNEFRDLLSFNLHHLPRTGAFLLTVVGLIGLHTWNFLPQICALDGSAALKALVYSTTLLLLLAAVVVLQLLFILISYRPSKNKAVLTEHVVHLDEDAILEETEFGSSRTEWSAVPRVAQNRHYIFLYVQQHMAHLVPKRAFESAAEAAEFFHYAKARSTNVRRR